MPSIGVRRLCDVINPAPGKLLNPAALTLHGGIRSDTPVLVLLAAGKGTRFGNQPKCIQPVFGAPLARHSIDAFRSVSVSPVIAVVGYRHDEVSAALGADNLFVHSENITGGTAFAAYEALSAPGLLEANPVVVITMGDRVVPASVFRRLLGTHTGVGNEDRGRRTDDRRQTTDGGSQRSEVRRQRESETVRPTGLAPTTDHRPPTTGSHGETEPEAALTFLTARYEPPRHQGKGRILRDSAGRVVRIVEQKDITEEPDPLTRQALESLTEGNCPLYATRAKTLARHLGALTNENAQGQYYLTDIIASIAAEGGEVRTVTTSPADPEYDLLCSDVTRPADLVTLERALARAAAGQDEIQDAVEAIRAGRPAGQVASIARQLEELYQAVVSEKLNFRPDQPVGIGISGGRLRIAFMHPDMTRFYGPAWQMPIGAADATGSEQIVVLAQTADDQRLHLHPLDPKYRESVNFVAADDRVMYPGTEVADWDTYEGFGTHMSETLLLSLGYFSDEELEARRRRGQPLPPASLRVSTNMRRPFALVSNAIASLRTLRQGELGARVQQALDRAHFHGLRIACTGGIPQGGFSSSSALTVATKNALNSLFALGIPADVLVHLACQAEYGTGVRAGSLDQATEQKGRAGEGTLISSNPADNYRILGSYKVPSERFRVIFPYTVERDRAAWSWSWGLFAETPSPDGPLTTGEIRKLTGKAAEIAAILTRLPLDTDFFKAIEADLLADGALDPSSEAWIRGILRPLPLLISRDALQARVAAQRDWYISELIRVKGLDPRAAASKTDALFASLFAGWRNPILRMPKRPGPGHLTGGNRENGGKPTSSVASVPSCSTPGFVASEAGVPLRAILAYLFHEVVTNFRLIHHPEEWIACVTRSQRGDCSVDIDYRRLPDRAAMESELDWERGEQTTDGRGQRTADGGLKTEGRSQQPEVGGRRTGSELLNAWLERYGATPYDFNHGLEDEVLVQTTRGQQSDNEKAFSDDARSAPPTSDLRSPTSSEAPSSDLCPPSSGSFFRGLALIDLAEAMLKRAFGADAVAVRVNAAGQGDYFQVHIDTEKAQVGDVKQFLRAAFYRRFGLSPEPEFVETNPGGGATGVTLSRFELLPEVSRALLGTSTDGTA